MIRICISQDIKFEWKIDVCLPFSSFAIVSVDIQEELNHFKPNLT